MKFRLLPKEEKFFELFKQQAETVKDGVEALQDLVDNYTDVEKKYQKIKDIEHQGDDVTHTIFAKLKTSFITPIDREDIHELASGLDDILDCIEGAARRLSHFKVADTTPELKQLVDVIDDAVHQVYQAVNHLERLEDTEKFCTEINKLENKADEICHRATSSLFEKAEKVEDIKNLIMWKDIYGRLEIAADRCEDVANVIEGIQIKNA